jgi:hypothetical protein
MVQTASSPTAYTATLRYPHGTKRVCCWAGHASRRADRRQTGGMHMTASRLRRVPSWRKCGPSPGPAPALSGMRPDAPTRHTRGKLGGRYRKQGIVKPGKVPANTPISPG